MSADVIELSTRLELSGTRIDRNDVEEALKAELRRARRRIRQLERNLAAAMRDSLANYNRAQEAERRLDEPVV